MSLLCPCNSQMNYELCCAPFMEKRSTPKTPEQLMRSRYTAYSQANIDYIKKTMQGKPLLHFQEDEAKQWAESVIWLGLKILDAAMETPEKGYVEFIATFIEKNRLKSIHERSEFHLHNEQWVYVDGINKKTEKPDRAIARNSICPCGSGKKFKNCHER